MSTLPNIRLPGVYFLPAPRVVPPGLPPLDVAGFVGLAERGPLDIPVPVEDIGVYSAIFGGDKPLARDEDGNTVYAYLPSSVAGFFANGGRRCWVVRVAGADATRTRMRIPGLIALGGLSSPSLASIQASSEGKWSERLKLAARLDVTPMPAAAFRVLSGNRVEWMTGSAPNAIRTGDLLRFAFPDGSEWLLAVGGLIIPPNSTPGTPVVINGNSWSLVTGADPSLPVPVNQIQVLTLDGRQVVAGAGELHSQDRTLELHLIEAVVVSPDQKPLSNLAPGDTLRLELADGRKLLFPITALKHSSQSGSPGLGKLIASADRGLDLQPQPLPVTSPPVFWRVERLRFELHIKDGSDRRAPLVDLGLNAGHPRFWGETALLESSALYRRSTVDQDGEAAAEAAALFRNLRRDTVTDPGTAPVVDVVSLAGLLSPLDEAQTSLTFLPLGMPQVLVEDDFIPPLPDEVGRDDLLTLDPRLFVDSYLVPNINVQTTSGPALMGEAFNRVYVQNRRLKGLHSLTFIDEVALLALPDAVQRGWEPIEPAKPAPPPVTSPPDGPPADQIDPALFIDCAPPVITGIKPVAGPLAGGMVVEITGGGFIERATRVSFGGRAATGVEVLCPRSLRCISPPGVMAGLVFIEVTTPNGVVIRPDAFSYESAPEEILPRPLLLQETDIEALIEVQQAAVNFCWARTDVVAILALPLHFEKREAILWLESLREKLGLPKRGSVFDDVRDIVDLSYAAVYHPWALIPDSSASGQLRSVPNDGIICGAIAARERERGVWVAPANTPLNGLIGPALEISTDDWADLFDLQFNLIRREPRDFRAMSAHTLSDQRDLLQLSVRRLMIQLRKAALELGMDYVFRPNNEHFRQAVRMAIEGLLKSMFERGAFAGDTPDDSYRVTIDESVNTRESIDQGRFIARIQVAPSEPMEFITVLLSRVGENLLEATEV